MENELEKHFDFFRKKKKKPSKLFYIIFALTLPLYAIILLAAISTGMEMANKLWSVAIKDMQAQEIQVTDIKINYPNSVTKDNPEEVMNKTKEQIIKNILPHYKLVEKFYKIDEDQINVMGFKFTNDDSNKVSCNITIDRLLHTNMSGNNFDEACNNAIVQLDSMLSRKETELTFEVLKQISQK